MGAANGANPLPIVVPCHRVIGSNGSLTGFGGGLPLKQALLALELGTRDGQRSLPHACGSGDRAVGARRPDVDAFGLRIGWRATRHSGLENTVALPVTYRGGNGNASESVTIRRTS